MDTANRYFTVMVVSYFPGSKYYPLPYQTGRIFMYLLLAVYLGVVAYAEKLPALMMR